MDKADEYFKRLRRRAPEPLLRNTSGTIRFDLTDGDAAETWHVTINRGAFAVSRKKADADAVVRCERAVFERLASGELNTMAAALRGLVVPEGDLGLVLSMSRIFRGAPDARSDAPAAGYAKRAS